MLALISFTILAVVFFPLFLAYEVGVAFASAQNGVDFVTRNVFALAQARMDERLAALRGRVLDVGAGDLRYGPALARAVERTNPRATGGSFLRRRVAMG